MSMKLLKCTGHHVSSDRIFIFYKFKICMSEDQHVLRLGNIQSVLDHYVKDMNQTLITHLRMLQNVPIRRPMRKVFAFTGSYIQTQICQQDKSFHFQKKTFNIHSNDTLFIKQHILKSIMCISSPSPGLKERRRQS